LFYYSSRLSSYILKFKEQMSKKRIVDDHCIFTCSKNKQFRKKKSKLLHSPIFQISDDTVSEDQVTDSYVSMHIAN
jgi:hypothetical protein